MSKENPLSHHEQLRYDYLFKNIHYLNEREKKEFAYLQSKLNMASGSEASPEIHNENFEESKVGIVTGLENERLQLKTLDKNLQFVEILNINYSDIHILYITNYCYKKLNQTF